MVSVLIVDDEKLVRNTLNRFIPWDEIGIDILYEAEDGRKGLEIAEKYQPSIIITDIKMPHMNGMDFARHIREFPWHSRLVFLSGYTDKEYLKGAIHLHVDGFIEKPLNPQEITSLMTMLAEQCRKDQAQTNATVFFFRGSHGPTPLSPDVFTLAKQDVHAFGSALKQKDRLSAVNTLNDLCRKMQSCESTPPDYIRNVFSQIALQIENAAQLHGAKSTQDKSGKFVYATVKINQFATLEHTANDLIDSFFAETDADAADPISLINCYLRTNYANCELSIQEIAKRLNFNATYLCTVYKQKTGRTINAALTDIRMETARNLLLETQLKLYEVGEKVGYRDGKYFTKVFTREVGISPRQYREHRYD